jgi:CRISPR-associated protein Csd2
MSHNEKNGTPFNRGTGLLVIEVRHSNPNGDPDSESEPRTIDNSGYGLISPVSFKRKLRDLVADKDGFAWQTAKEVLGLEDGEDKRMIWHNTKKGMGEKTEPKEFKAKYNILETRFRKRENIEKMDAVSFASEFWDARVFGNTFLESLKKGDGEEGESIKEREKRDHFISTGVVQFGVGVSIAPLSIIRSTWTNKAGVEKEKVQGMAPSAWRVVEHAVYVMPFFVNPFVGMKTGCGGNDVKLLQFMIPHAYRLTASVPRAQVEILHAWYAEHKSPLGSCPDFMIIDPLTPKKTGGEAKEPSTSLEEYKPIPDKLPEDVRARLNDFKDLCTVEWK